MLKADCPVGGKCPNFSSHIDSKTDSKIGGASAEFSYLEAAPVEEPGFHAQTNRSEQPSELGF